MMGYGLLIPFLLWAPGLLPYCTGEKNLYTVTCALTAADGDSSKTIQVVIEGGVGIQAKVDASFQASVNEHFHGDFSSIESKSLRKCIQKAIDDGDIPYVGQDILYEGGGGLFGHVDFFNGMHWLDSVQRSSTMNEDHVSNAQQGCSTVMLYWHIIALALSYGPPIAGLATLARH